MHPAAPVAGLVVHLIPDRRGTTAPPSTSLSPTLGSEPLGSLVLPACLLLGLLLGSPCLLAGDVAIYHSLHRLPHHIEVGGVLQQV